MSWEVARPQLGKVGSRRLTLAARDAVCYSRGLCYKSLSVGGEDARSGLNKRSHESGTGWLLLLLLGCSSGHQILGSPLGRKEGLNFSSLWRVTLVVPQTPVPLPDSCFSYPEPLRTATTRQREQLMFTEHLLRACPTGFAHRILTTTPGRRSHSIHML